VGCMGWGHPEPGSHAACATETNMRVIIELLDSITVDHEVTELCVGAFFTAVVSRGCGLASTMRGRCCGHEGPSVHNAGSLLPQGARALARQALSGSEMEASIGLAALNSLLEVDESRLADVNASDLLFQRATGRRVALIGDFPFVPELGRRALELWTLDLREPGPEGELERLMARLPEADVCAITGTTLINHTLPDIVDRLRPDCFRLMLGPTTPLSPVLFEYGLDVLSGVVVTDPQRAMACVRQGAGFRQIEGRRLVSMVRGGRGSEPGK
jgi:uncharacterized protein